MYTNQEKRLNIKLVEIYGTDNETVVRNYSLRTIYINPDHVVCMREDTATKGLLSEGRLPQNLDARQNFTRITINKGTYGQEIVVVGAVDEVYNKLKNQKLELLRG